MQFVTTGLVLREVKVGEADRILTLLTPEGILSASAKGSLRPKSRLFSASGLFCYSEWTLQEGKTIHRVDAAAPLEVFFALRESVEAVALAAYIAEVLQIISPTGAEADGFLRLALNCLHVLAQKLQPPAKVKAVFELRVLQQEGVLPELDTCSGCGGAAGDVFLLEPGRGRLLCGGCLAKKELRANLDMSALVALRHIAGCAPKQIFNFTLSGSSTALLRQLAEDWALYHLDYPPKSLVFLKTVLPPGEDVF